MAEHNGRLKGKVAVVTGGSRGIGAATAKRLAAEGATVVVNYARSADAADEVVKRITEAGGEAVAVQAEVSDERQVKAMFEKVDERFGGRVDVLVNNAGVFETAPIEEASTSHLDGQLSVNVRAVFAVTREAIRRMGEGGRIITIGSCLGERLPFPGGAAYGASKAAAKLLGQGWARDLGPRGITVNTVQPGPIDTEMNPADASKNPAADYQRSLTALGRYGKPEEIAAAVAFLASPEASYITGATLNVDGGFNA